MSPEVIDVIKQYRKFVSTLDLTDIGARLNNIMQLMALFEQLAARLNEE